MNINDEKELIPYLSNKRKEDLMLVFEKNYILKKGELENKKREIDGLRKEINFLEDEITDYKKVYIPQLEKVIDLKRLVNRIDNDYDVINDPNSYINLSDESLDNYVNNIYEMVLEKIGNFRMPSILNGEDVLSYPSNNFDNLYKMKKRAFYIMIGVIMASFTDLFLSGNYLITSLLSSLSITSYYSVSSKFKGEMDKYDKDIDNYKMALKNNLKIWLIDVKRVILDMIDEINSSYNPGKLPDGKIATLDNYVLFNKSVERNIHNESLLEIKKNELLDEIRIYDKIKDSLNEAIDNMFLLNDYTIVDRKDKRKCLRKF